MNSVSRFLDNYILKLSLPHIGIIDIIEILIISVFIYQFMIWIKQTRAYALLKGIMVLLCFVVIIYLFKMNTLIWLVNNVATVMVTALVIIFQPELRKILEQLGQKNVIASVIPFERGKEVQARFTDKTVNEIVKACFDMGEACTGALIVIEQEVVLSEYERTGILLDSLITSQLLINIFEHNTPLHDGAVIVRGNRIVAATCYLPLSDNMELSKQLGTRHRAGVGISEVSDSLTIIVSEETGEVSTALNGKLRRNISEEQLKEQLIQVQNKKVINNSKLINLWKGRAKYEKKSDH